LGDAPAAGRPTGRRNDVAHTSEAVRGLKEWQRDRGQQEEQALRELQRALTRLERLGWERTTAETARDRAIHQLARSGITVEALAVFLGVDVAAISATRRPGKPNV
jgi:DNA-binding CsgD family transcriptional regulator